ncbi:hypothetical protein CP532_2116 [Ophiocordyceps camponoti-leonardi (nom. inval.)]|nr:hypothetical protein CP532_2116 [Ophiocordyceps camponoti-leonardi (nom. inval.)]
MSSNPFRKKTVEALDTAKTRAPSPAKSSLRSGSPLADGGRPKVVKKVRVLSPPPLSPDSPDWPTGGYENVLRNDSFAVEGHAALGQAPPMTWPSDNNAAYQPASAPPSQAVAPGAGAAQGTPPPNPFSKTLQDLESNKELQSQRQGEGLALKVGNASRQSLNVDSFKRLLLTGTANDTESSASADGGATTGEGVSRDDNGEGDEGDDDKSSTSAASLSDGDDRLASPTTAPQSASREKKAPPPPPSSRHGKSLRDAPKAGPVPEPEPEPEAATETDPHRASLTPPSGRRKSAPAPPPPRGHSRTESRNAQLSASLSTEPNPLKPPADEVSTPISPAETPTRSDGSRNNSRAPNPPPPRRPRLSTPTSPPGAPSAQPAPLTPPRHHETDHAPTSAHEDAQAESAKPAGPPPPPPTRNLSVRRRPSVGSVESVNRREARTREGAAPPPPPPRQRGNSVGSVDASPRHVSVADGAVQGATTVNGAADDGGGDDSGKGSDILADLDALQREVDALRGQLG